MIINLSKLDGDTLTTKHPHNIDTDEILSIEGCGNYTFGYTCISEKGCTAPLNYASVKFAELSTICPNQFLVLELCNADKNNGTKLVLDLDVENMPKAWIAINVDLIESIGKKYKLTALNAKIIQDYEKKIEKKLEGKETLEEMKERKDASRDYITKINMNNGVYYLVKGEYDDVVDAVNNLLSEKNSTASV